jgi:small-conductance mechanosensitive channel
MPALDLIITKAIAAALIIIATLIAAKLTTRLVRYYSKQISHILPSSSIFTNIARVAVLVCGGLILLQTLGISITPLITALGVGGLAVALAFQDTLSNIFSGLQILVSQQLKPGDYVKLETGEEGVVEDITWRNTTIKSLTDNLIIVPNNKLSTSVITNYSKPRKTLIVSLSLGVSYDSDLDQVERVAIETAQAVLKKHPGGNTEVAPQVRFVAFGPSSIDFQLIVRVTAFDEQALIKHELIKALSKRFTQEGIEIPYPKQVVHLAKEGG